ncbi:NAD(P)H-hydrate epimerase, partial [Acinetobacter baumannii]
VLVDALFGTGLTRALDAQVVRTLAALVDHARLSVAVDLPSGAETDAGGDFGATLPRFDVTLALGALKPAHVLQPLAALCGVVRL